MKTAKQIKKEASERFEKVFEEFLNDNFDLKITNFVVYKIFQVIDQLIDTTIKQTLEGVREWALSLDMEFEGGYTQSGWEKEVDDFIKQTSKGD